VRPNPRLAAPSPAPPDQAAEPSAAVGSPSSIRRMRCLSGEANPATSLLVPPRSRHASCRCRRCAGTPPLHEARAGHHGRPLVASFRSFPFASSAIVAARSQTLSSPQNPAACAGNSPCCRSQPSHPNFHKFLSCAFVRISYVHLRMHFYNHLFYLFLATCSCCPYLVVPC
jgi:hypothetical protein